MRSRVIITSVIIILALSFSYALADVPQMINYQGKLTKPNGALVDTSVSMLFSIYADSSGGTALWTETHSSVEVEYGVFNVLLGGETTTIPDSVFDGSVRYLGITVGTDSEMSPRKAIVSVGYAYRAKYAQYAEEAISDGDWTYRITDTADTTLMTGGGWGIARAGNVLYGNQDSTHVNLGSACTTGVDGQNYYYCTVGGGRLNRAKNNYATVGGGLANTASSTLGVVAGGQANTASGTHQSAVGGGYRNTASHNYATVAGGYGDTASGEFSTVGGGFNNIASYSSSTVGGGFNNTASNSSATIGGGYSNEASGNRSTVGGGYDNIASGSRSTVGGGEGNTASSDYSTVPGGYWNTAAGDYSLASGDFVVINSAADYTFAFGRDFTTSTPNAVIFSHPSAATRMGINLTNPTYAVHLPNNANNSGQGMANAWNTYSSIRWKENIRQIENPMDKVMALRGVYFNLKESNKRDVGLIAEEVGEVIPELVTYEENGIDAEGLDYSRLSALFVEAIKEQQNEIELLKKEIEILKRSIK